MRLSFAINDEHLQISVEMVDANGYCQSDFIYIPLEELEIALSQFRSPSPDSSPEDHPG